MPVPLRSARCWLQLLEHSGPQLHRKNRDLVVIARPAKCTLSVKHDLQQFQSSLEACLSRKGCTSYERLLFGAQRLGCENLMTNLNTSVLHSNGKLLPKLIGFALANITHMSEKHECKHLLTILNAVLKKLRLDLAQGRKYQGRGHGTSAQLLVQWLQSCALSYRVSGSCRRYACGCTACALKPR